MYHSEIINTIFRYIWVSKIRRSLFGRGLFTILRSHNNSNNNNSIMCRSLKEVVGLWRSVWHRPYTYIRENVRACRTFGHINQIIIHRVPFPQSIGLDRRNDVTAGDSVMFLRSPASVYRIHEPRTVRRQPLLR